MNGKLAAAKIYEGFVSKTTCAFAFISSVLYTFFRTVMLLGWAVKYQKADFRHERNEVLILENQCAKL